MVRIRNILDEVEAGRCYSPPPPAWAKGPNKDSYHLKDDSSLLRKVLLPVGGVLAAVLAPHVTLEASTLAIGAMTFAALVPFWNNFVSITLYGSDDNIEDVAPANGSINLRSFRQELTESIAGKYQLFKYLEGVTTVADIPLTAGERTRLAELVENTPDLWIKLLFVVSRRSSVHTTADDFFRMIFSLGLWPAPVSNRTLQAFSSKVEYTDLMPPPHSDITAQELFPEFLTESRVRAGRIISQEELDVINVTLQRMPVSLLLALEDIFNDGSAGFLGQDVLDSLNGLLTVNDKLNFFTQLADDYKTPAEEGVTIDVSPPQAAVDRVNIAVKKALQVNRLAQLISYLMYSDEGYEKTGIFEEFVALLEIDDREAFIQWIQGNEQALPASKARALSIAVRKAQEIFALKNDYFIREEQIYMNFRRRLQLLIK